MPQKISYLGFRHTSSGGQRKQLVHGCRNPPMSQLEWVEELQRKNGKRTLFIDFKLVILTSASPLAGDGIVVKGRAYGIRSIRVDGNDALAVYSAILRASEIAITEQRPILVEALTYRVGHNSTSDYSTKYRTADEIEYWKMARNPVNRFRKWVERNGWWSDEAETELRSRSSVKKQKRQKPPIAEMFTDVYDQTPQNLKDQEKLLRESIRKHPQDYTSEVPI
ncbi:2-oxoisovalerate dehydrogenase subunit alpha [Morus notabilis]|uniref:2-oxoisovalerate dehydrogenase subunit alpha n=1 Tax=Morus notabilis TaxID=981085 RepID=W9R3Z6_9ROSA|nr:2-oxoisovalerate dehydrogenase subunit alpha [Morus notabilis]